MVKFDIKVAFLTTDVDPKHKYYVRRPSGTRNEEVPYISEPACYVYGHPLASESFSKKLEAKLLEVGGKQTLYDPSLYSINTELGRALVSTTVDDMPALHSGGKPMFEYLKENLSEFFDTTCDAPMTNAFGMEVTRNKGERKITY